MNTGLAESLARSNVDRSLLDEQPESQRDSATLSPCDFDIFVRAYAGRLLTVARRFLRHDEHAADAVQDALLSAFATRDKFRGNSTVYTWLYRIVVNTCLMNIRSRPRATAVSLDELLPAFDEQGRHAKPIVDFSHRVENRLECEETRAAVRACIDQLPDHYRMILLLRDIEEFTTEQTAELLDLSRVAVKTRLHRARQALRTLLEPVLE